MTPISALDDQVPQATHGASLFSDVPIPACPHSSPDIWGHPQYPLDTGQTTPALVHLTIMTLVGSTFDRAKASRADVEHPSMARRNRAEVVVADEIGGRKRDESGTGPLAGRKRDGSVIGNMSGTKAGRVRY